MIIIIIINVLTQTWYSSKRVLASWTKCIFWRSRHKCRFKQPARHNFESNPAKTQVRENRNYNRRIMEVEHGSFTPLVFTTSGVMSHECSIFHKALAEKLAEKTGERYEEVTRLIRIKLSFLVLRGALLCLRGSRSIYNNDSLSNCQDFRYNLNELSLG